MVLYRGKITLEQLGASADLEHVGRAMAGIA
jgi:hypothetical protein